MTPVQNGFWAGMFAAALALAFAAPARAAPLVLATGFVARGSRDLLLQLGVAMPTATLLAALLATALALTLDREPASAPVAAITAVLPLGPTGMFLSAIEAAFHVFARDPAVAASAGAVFTTNSLKAIIVVAAMAIGTTLPLLLSRDRY
jgi:uncharacterized membrane protein YjjB (DUF3815 family)